MVRTVRIAGMLQQCLHAGPHASIAASKRRHLRLEALRLPGCGLLTIHLAETQAAPQAGEAMKLWTGQRDVLHCGNACITKTSKLCSEILAGRLLLEMGMLGESSLSRWSMCNFWYWYAQIGGRYCWYGDQCLSKPADAASMGSIMILMV